MTKYISTFIFITLSFTLSAQQVNNPFKSFEIFVDSASFNLEENTLSINDKDHLYFNFNDKDETILVRFTSDTQSIKLVPSNDFTISDSLIFIDKNEGEFKIKFKDLINTNFLKFRFEIAKNDTSGSQKKYFDVNLIPVTSTRIEIDETTEELYIGEEKVFEILTNHPDNLKLNNQWQREDNFDYRFEIKTNQIFLHIIPNKDGRRLFSVNIKTRKPSLTENNSLDYSTPEFSKHFTVKSIRLKFLNIDKKDISLEEDAKLNGIETQIEDARLLQINKTYRLENQEEKGGPLIAELFTKSRLSNGKVLCIIRPFNYHRTTEGYLYIKDGDQPRFITNFSITPRTSITSIKILRDGRNWQKGSDVYPGETIYVRLEGEGFHKADFRFEDVHVIQDDSLKIDESRAEYRIKIPIDITRKEIAIYNHAKRTGKFLTVKEYQKPKEFDFINVDYGERKLKYSGIRGPRINYNTIKDINLSFSEFRIDDEDDLYGKQYVDFEINVTDKNNKLMEMKSIKNIVICPSNESPRYQFYDRKDCLKEDISLNNHLRNKTYELPEWSRVRITAKHSDDKYTTGELSKEIEIIQGVNYKFDVEVSFPAGLISIFKQEKQREVVNMVGDTIQETYSEVDYGNFGGISMAMIGQFSFYHPDKINRYRPYKVGAGFIAMNAFNFKEDANKDIGIVVLGSVYPTTKDTKLSFPLYVGGGYLVQESRLFFLIGPGIRVKL